MKRFICLMLASLTLILSPAEIYAATPLPASAPEFSKETSGNKSKSDTSTGIKIDRNLTIEKDFVNLDNYSIRVFGQTQYKYEGIQPHVYCKLYMTPYANNATAVYINQKSSDSLSAPFPSGWNGTVWTWSSGTAKYAIGSLWSSIDSVTFSEDWRLNGGTKFLIGTLEALGAGEKPAWNLYLTLGYEEGLLYPVVIARPAWADNPSYFSVLKVDTVLHNGESFKVENPRFQLQMWKLFYDEYNTNYVCHLQGDSITFEKPSTIITYIQEDVKNMGDVLYPNVDYWSKASKNGNTYLQDYSSDIQKMFLKMFEQYRGDATTSYEAWDSLCNGSDVPGFKNSGVATLWKSCIDITKKINDANDKDAADKANDKVKAEESDANFETWCNAMVVLSNGGTLTNVDQSKYEDMGNLLSSSKVHYLFDRQLVTALASAWNDDPSILSSYKNEDGNPKTVEQGDAYDGSDIMPRLQADAESGMDVPLAQACEDVMATEFSHTEDLSSYMLTCNARAIYWKYAAMNGVTESMQKYRSKFDNIRDSGLGYFRSHSETANIRMSYFDVQDLVALRNYIEVTQEIQDYVTTSLKYIKDACSENGDIEEQKKWYKALYQLQECITTLGNGPWRNIWESQFSEYYNYLQDTLGDIKDLGDLADDPEPQAGDALPMFFASISGQKLTDDEITGIAYSAAFVPMRTNMYDPYTTKDWNKKFLQNFHYKYGYYRKALYKADSSSSAAELKNTSLTGTMSVCTLKDLIDPAGDIVLYVDDNFYNVDDLAEVLDMNYNKIINNQDGDQKADTDNDDEKDNIVQKWWVGFTDGLSDLMDLDISSQVKTGDKTQYSQKLRNKVAFQSRSDYYPTANLLKESNSSKDEDIDDNKDHIVLTSGEINDYLSMSSNKPTTGGDAQEVYDDYNVMQSYAVVSSVYRCQALFNLANSNATHQPVFIASDTVPNMNSAKQDERNEIFNWLLLKNIKSQMPVGYNTSLDMESPVYIDVYGNILTESGYVVVPAASNATLFSSDYYTYGANMGLLYTYGKDYELGKDDVQSVLNGTLMGMMEQDQYLDTWKMKSTLFARQGDIGYDLDMARISIADKDTKEMMQDSFYTYLYCNSQAGGSITANTDPGYDFNKYAGIILEVMRGAPIECIDKDFEDLNTARTMTNAGLSAAAKLEVLDSALADNGANTLLALPNLAFVDGFEYICLFAFKIIMLLVILVLMFTLYRDMVGQSFSWQTLFKCIALVLCTCLAIVTIPTVFDISYYQANKLLLQDETEYIAMLNEEKRQNGVEIGVTELTEPDTSTKLLLKLDTLDIPWYDLFSKIMLSSTFKSLDEVYAQFYDDSPISQQEDVTLMNDGVYVYVDDLFDSASIDIDPDTGMLELRTDEITTAAFYTPYYVILEALVTDINEFNDLNQWKGYTTTLQKGGRLKSLGVCQGYFNDKTFMQSEGDILHLHEVYGLPAELATVDVWSDEDVALMQKCEWSYGSAGAYKRLYKISDRAREFVAKNKNLLGKISDETFLKVMALDIAMYHNSIFGVDSCNAIEIEQLSQDDLCRLMLGTREEAMYNSSLSFGRYVYQIGGSFAVYLAAAFELIMFVIGFIKPVLTLGIFIAIFASLFIFKVIMRKKTASMYGYMVTTLLTCLCNFGHALALKACMFFPTLGLTPSVCVLLCSLIQFIYVVCLAGVAWTSLKDWRDLGFARYQYKASQMTVGANELLAKMKFKMHFKGSNKERVRVGDLVKNNDDGGMKTYDDLSLRRESRKKRYGIG